MAGKFRPAPYLLNPARGAYALARRDLAGDLETQRRAEGF